MPLNCGTKQGGVKMLQDELDAFNRGWTAGEGKSTPVNPFDAKTQEKEFKAFVFGYEQANELLEVPV